MIASHAWVWNLCGRDKAQMQRRLEAMGDRLYLQPHTRAEWLAAGFPRVAPAPEGKGRSKGTRRQRKAAR